MSEVACNVSLPSIGYPPVRYNELDKQNLVKLRELKDAAPFGRTASGAPRSEISYRVLVSNQKKRLLAPDFRWPFWGGLALGSAGFLLLLARRR